MTKALHPTYGAVEIVREVDDEKTLCRLANGVLVELTTTWLVKATVTRDGHSE